MILSCRSAFIAWVALQTFVRALRVPPDPTSADRQLTNAQRIARGLSLNKPLRLYDPTAVRPRDTAPSGGASTGADTVPVVVGSDEEGTDPFGRKKRAAVTYYRYLLINDEGGVGVTVDPALASRFILPPSGGGSLQWVPTISEGGFSGGTAYSMAVYIGTQIGLESPGFDPALTAGISIVLFGNIGPGALMPEIDGTPMMFFVDPQGGSIFLAPSPAVALAGNPRLRPVAAAAVPSGQDPATALRPAIDALQQKL